MRASMNEYGGDVFPVNAKWLHFYLEDGREIFSQHVRIPERSYMRSSMKEMKPEFVAEMKAAAKEATGQRRARKR